MGITHEIMDYLKSHGHPKEETFVKKSDFTKNVNKNVFSGTSSIPSHLGKHI
jgi:hypothetical protein